MNNSTKKNTITNTNYFMKKIYTKLLLGLLFVLGTIGANAQVANYSFAASSATYTALVAPTNVFASGWDDNTAISVPIGFTFNFNGIGYTSVFVHPNGYITFGSSTSGYLPISGGSAVSGVISAWGRDLQAQNTAPLGSVDYLSSGGVFTIQWSNTRRYNSTTTNAERFEMQIQLFQTTDVVKIVYGTWSAAVSATTTNNGEVGLRGASGTDFKNLEVLSTGNWSTPTAGTLNTQTCYYNQATPAIKPASGQTYTFTPAAPCTTPTSLAASASITGSTAGTISGNFTAAPPTAPTGYVVVRTPTNVQPTPVDGTTYTVGSNAIGYIEYVNTVAGAWTSTGLNGSTTYYYWVFSYNNTVCTGGPTYSATATTTNGTTTACSMTGTFDVGPAAVSGYLTLKQAVDAVVANGVTGPVIFELNAAYSSATDAVFPIVLGAVPCASATNTITIRPAAGAGAKTITSANATATIDINGGGFWIIDGQQGGTGGTKDLTIANTLTTATSGTIRFINDGNNNTIKYCNITGAATTTTVGVVTFSTTTGTLGNSNNTINNCDIRENATGTPTNGIYSAGTTAFPNNANTISNNNIFNFFTSGVINNGVLIAAGNNAWTLSGNHLYQTATRTFTASNIHNGISITSGAGYTISGNFIGGGAPSAGGTAYTIAGAFTNRFIAINLASLAGVTSSIQGNTIANFVLSTTSGASTTNGVWCGINVTGTGSTNIGNTTLNTIGSGTGNGSITTTSSTTAALTVGINVSATGTLTISNNVIGSITANGSTTSISASIAGIQLTGGTTPIITNNTIGSTSTTNSINSPTIATVGSQLINGITLSAAITTATTITGNTIANMNQAGTTVGAVIRGIIYSGTGFADISSNTVRNLSGASSNTTAAGGATAVQGICYTGTSPLGATVSLNTIYTISATNAGAVQTNATAIGFSNPTSGRIFRNMIYDIRNASTMAVATTPPTASGILLRAAPDFIEVSNNMISLGSAQTTNTEFIGIWNSFSTAATLRVYYNSVHIGGTATVGALPSFGFLRGDNTAASAMVSPVDIKNNILNNTRTGGTGKHYAIGNVVTVPATGWAAGASDFNALNSPVSTTIGIWGLAADQTFASWKTISSSDVNSISGIPVTFVDAPNGNLHLNMGVTPTQLESGGTTIPGLAIDYDNQVRPGPAGSVNGGGTAPDLGADEFDGVPLDLSGPVITYTPLTFTCSASNRTLTATITDLTGVPTSGTLQPRIYYKKSTDASYVSTQGSLSSGTGTNGTWTFTLDYSLVGGGSVTPGDVIQYFVIAQDLASPPNISSNPSGVVATDVNTVSTPPTPNTYSISGTLSGNYNVGTGQTYPTLTAAIAAYNTSCLSGAVIFSLTDAAYTEAAAMTINTNANASAVNTLTIKPTQANTTIAVTGGSTGAIITLNGADYVTINGSISATVNTVCPAVAATRDLTITNTNAGTSSAVVWLQTTAGADAATNNKVINCNLVGSGVTQTLFGAGAGSATISITSLGTANNNNSYVNNNISGVQYGIYTQGASAANKNSGTIINQNLINTSANTRGGIWVGFENNITISGNNVSNIAQTTSPDVFGITLGMGIAVSATTSAGNEVTNATVTKNVIGSVVNTGTFSAVGIAVASATTGTTLLANNMISGVAANGTLGDFAAGIILGGGTGSTTNVYYNTVSMQGTITGASAATQTSACIAVTNSTAPTLDFRNNIFSNTQLGNTGATLRFATIALAYSTYATLTSNYNDLYAAGAGPGTYTVGITGTVVGGTNSVTLANWQATTGKDANSLSILPNFVSTTDLHLVAATNCTLDAAGTPVSVTDDIDCATRDASTPDIGADEFMPTTTLAGLAGGAQVCESAAVGTGKVYKDGTCNPIARVIPAGATPVSGTINACVTIDATVQFFNSSPYLQRHFDIQPATNPTTATGRVTLYALQTEFDAYNAVAGGFPLLPTGPTDVAGIANLRITQYNGTGTAPGNYTGASVLINPADVDIVWNGFYWEISFNVTGFGGFYIHTKLGNGPLPITINYFNGTKQGINHLLNWKVTCNASPSATMILERSADSRNFTGINTVVADAARCNQPFSYTDAQPLPGMNYYRLKMVDVDGKISYSGIVALLNATKGFDIISIAPNPVVTGSFKLNVTSAQSSKMDITIIDMQGRLVSKQTVSLIAGFTSLHMEVGNLAAGTYTIQGSIADEKTRVIRFVKQ